MACSRVLHARGKWLRCHLGQSRGQLGQPQHAAPAHHDVDAVDYGYGQQHSCRPRDDVPEADLDTAGATWQAQAQACKTFNVDSARRDRARHPRQLRLSSRRPLYKFKYVCPVPSPRQLMPFLAHVLVSVVAQRKDVGGISKIDSVFIRGNQ